MKRLNADQWEVQGATISRHRRIVPPPISYPALLVWFEVRLADGRFLRMPSYPRNRQPFPFHSLAAAIRSLSNPNAYTLD